MPSNLMKKKKMMAPLDSSIRLQIQQRSLNKTLGEEAREAMHQETMKLGKKTLRPSVRWDHQIMAEAKEEIAVAINKEVIITGVIEALITTIEATTTATEVEGDGLGVVIIRKVKEAGITMERIEGATIKTAKGKEVATAMEVAEVAILRQVAIFSQVIEVAILREVIGVDTTAWEEVEVQEVGAIKRANN